MAASRRPRTAAWDRRRRGKPRAEWHAPAPRSTPGNGGGSQPTASAGILFTFIVAGVGAKGPCDGPRWWAPRLGAFVKPRASLGRAPNHIKVHALPDVPA